MANSIGDLIWQMSGKEDPRQALMAQVAGGDDTSSGVDTQQAAPAPPTNDAVTAGPTPENLKSTPDMMELYTQLMEKEQFETGINRGLGLIFSSMAYDENKQSILNAYGVGSGGSSSGGSNSADGGLDFMSKIMKLQGDQAALAQKAAHRAALPAIAKQYGLDLETAQYLFDAGTLDAVIAEAEKPNKQIVKSEDGTNRIVDLTDGSMSDPFGAPKKREVEIVTDVNTGRQFAVYKDDKTPVGGPDIVAGKRKTEILEGQGGEKTLIYSDNKAPVEDRGPLVKGVPGNTEKSQLYHEAMADNIKRGLPEIPMDEWLKQQARAGANDANSIYGDPPTDMAWKRNENGEIELDERGAPIALPIGSSKLDAEKAAADKAAAQNAKTKSDTANVVSEDIDRAVSLIESESDTWLPVTGLGALLKDVPGTDAGELAGFIDTIGANIGFDKLNQIRAGNITGGGLGPISDFENRLLQATYGSLRQKGQEANLKYNLRRVQKLYNYLITRPDDKPITSEAEALQIMGDDPDVDALIKQYTEGQ